MLDLTALWQLVDLDRPDLKAPTYVPVVPLRLLPHGRGRAGRRVRPDPARRHLPAPPVRVVHRLGRAVHRPGRRRPDVLTIKQTLYRTSGDSPIVRALIRAAEQGKQVVVLVEIKARFDEENNIVWARRAGAGGRARRVRPRGPQDALEGRARRAPRGVRAPPLPPHRHRQLQLEDRPAVRGPRDPVLPRGAGRGRHRPVQRAHRPVPPAGVPAPARRADHAPRPDPRAHRARGGARTRRDARPDRAQGQLARRHARSSRRCTTPRRAGVEVDCIVRGACCLVPGPARRLGPHPRPLDRGRVPRALADLDVRQRRPARVVHRLGRPHGAQPRPAGRGGDARRGPARHRRGSRASSR